MVRKKRSKRHSYEHFRVVIHLMSFGFYFSNGMCIVVFDACLIVLRLFSMLNFPFYLFFGFQKTFFFLHFWRICVVHIFERNCASHHISQYWVHVHQIVIILICSKWEERIWKQNSYNNNKIPKINTKRKTHTIHWTIWTFYFIKLRWIFKIICLLFGITEAFMHQASTTKRCDFRKCCFFFMIVFFPLNKMVMMMMIYTHGFPKFIFKYNNACFYEDMYIH